MLNQLLPVDFSPEYTWTPKLMRALVHGHTSLIRSGSIKLSLCLQILHTAVSFPHNVICFGKHLASSFLPKYYWTWTRQYKIFHFFSRVRANFYVHISFLTWCLIIESTQLYPMVPHHHWVIVRRINSAPSGINSTELFSVISSLLLRHCLCLLLIIEGNYNNLLITCFFVCKI